MLKISPSTLIWDRQRCQRCFYLKVKHNLRPPGQPFPSVFNQIHGWIYERIDAGEIPLALSGMPRGELVYTEKWVESNPIHGVSLYGRLDGLIKTHNGYTVMDVKTTQHLRYLSNYSLQLNIYAYCLEHPATGALSVSPITGLGLLVFAPDRFSFESGRTGVEGQLKWHEITKDNQEVAHVVREVSSLLENANPPDPNPNCEWCSFYERLGVTMPL